MITDLTPEQEAQLAVYADKWREIALSTDPASRPEAEEGVRLAYALAGLKPPQAIIWVESPIALFPDYKKIFSNSLQGVIYDVLSSVRHEAFSNFDKQTYWKIINKIQDELLVSVGPINDLILTLLDEMYPRIIIEGDSTGQREVGYLSHSGSAYHFLSGQHDAMMLMRYLYLNEIIPIKSIGSLTAFSIVARHAGRWLPFQDTCYISERHNIINLDDQNRPHCADGLAIGYPDGWGVYAWHGVRVPEWVIKHLERITIEMILAERNIQFAQAMIERYGWNKFINNGQYVMIQSDDYGDLYRIDVSGYFPAIVNVKDNDITTVDPHFLYVPSHIRTAKDGVEWDRQKH